MNSIKKFNQPVVEKIGANNLDIYIPRISEKYSEDEVKFMFANMGMALVEYVDFVATKDTETKEIKFYSAFLRIKEWNPDGYWYNKIIVEKQNKIQISISEFWIILLAKTPLSRSKVNTHQLAAYTDELFVRVEAIEKNIPENITVTSTHFQNLLAKSESQASQIDQLMKIVAEQSNQLSRINSLLFQEQPETKLRSLTIEDLESEELSPVVFETQKQLNSHSTVCVPKEESKPEKKPIIYCEDECFFLKPLNITENTKQRSPINPKADIISGSFTFNIDDIVAPVAKSMGVTEKEVRKGLEKEWVDSQRVKSSKNICGNM
jgi:hypothetical protein